MSADSTTPPPAWPPRRRARWAGVGVALAVLGWAGWYFGIALPEQRDAAAAAALRAANARTIPDLNLDLVWMAPGDFLMGTPEQNLLVKWFYLAREKLTKQPNLGAGEANERPVTWVTLTQPFWLGRTAVTQTQYEAVMGTLPDLHPCPDCKETQIKDAGGDFPVEGASWDEAMAFCQKLTDREKSAGRLPPGYAYTLPTEAQREYSCRAGTTGDYAGDLDAMAWCYINSGGTKHAVATKQPNAWGLFDMHGNVWEWCRDWYGAYPGGEVTNPLGPPTGTYHVYRGGGWYFDAADCRSACRGRGNGYRDDNMGFRVALAPSPTK
jgi:formylglycine-generating enzyme required for sulfatase activity